MRFLDTNVLVDAILDQGTATRPASLELLERAFSGREEVRTTGLVLAEVFWTLRSARGGRVDRRVICDFLRDIIESPGLQMESKEVWLETLRLLADSGLDFPDAHLVATMRAEGATEIYSYDSDFDRITGIARLEP